MSVCEYVCKVVSESSRIVHIMIAPFKRNIRAANAHRYPNLLSQSAIALHAIYSYSFITWGFIGTALQSLQ